MTRIASAARPAPLRGIVPPMVTPLLADDALDVAGTERLIEHMIGGGVHGLFVLGTSGELAGLTTRLRHELIDRSCQQAAGRVPVLVGVADTCQADSIALARHAAETGADAVVVTAPYYLPLEQSELIEYVLAVVAGQPLPVYLYNIPFITKTAFEPETVARLAEVERIVGIKDSSGDLPYLQDLQRRIGRPDWSFFVGTEAQMAEAVRTGSHGAVGGGANLDPAAFAAQYAAAVRGDLASVARLQDRILRIDRVYRLGTGVASIIRGIKCALSLMGICSDRLAAPFRQSSEAERLAIRGYLADLDLLAGAGARSQAAPVAGGPPAAAGARASGEIGRGRLQSA